MTASGDRFSNPSDADIADLLRRVRTIAVVGLSPQPSRPSFSVAKALQGFGYRIVPVRPAVAAVLGEKAWSSLEDVPGPIDLVDVFRAPEHVDAIVDSCIALRAASPGNQERRCPWVLWLQLGVVNEAAAARARAAGMVVVMDRCLMVEFRRLGATVG